MKVRGYCSGLLAVTFVQTQIHYQLLQPRILVPQLLRFLCFAHVHPAVDRVLRHSHFPPHILRLPSRLQLFERSNHLRFGEIALRQEIPFPRLGNRTYL